MKQENEAAPVMRAKLKIQSVEANETIRSERIVFSAVCADSYSTDGLDENNTFARFTPSADLTMQINNPELFGKLKEGDTFYVDFTKAD